MLPGFFLFLLFFLCESTVTTVTTNLPSYFTSNMTTVEATTISTSTLPEKLSALQVEVVPDYPVAAGQPVNLHCSAFTVPANVNWSWHHLEDLNWREVSSSRDLTLTEPEQSGVYCCYAVSPSSQRWSRNLTVFIIATRPTVRESLGIAAFVLSLLALIIIFTALCWLGWQRFSGMLTTSNTAAKGFPGTEKAPKGGFPQVESDGDVYMNYTSTNKAYSDLDPTNMTGDNVYSSLS
ncbi:uncharacterized protein LOC108875078 [Lates japonicus]